MFKKNLRQQSDKALGVFRSTVERLASINLAADIKCEELETKVQGILKEQADLNSLRSSNNRVIEKINTFLQD